MRAVLGPNVIVSAVLSGNGTPAVRSPDPGDDYLVSLAEAAQAVIVSGDAHLQGLAGQVPVYTPAAFLTFLTTEGQ